MGFHTCYRIKLLSGGQCDLSVEVHVLSVQCVIRGKAFTLALLRCQSGTSMHTSVGGVGIHGEQGLAFACCTKTHYPAWCPPPSPIHPLSPLQNPPLAQPHPPGPLVLAAPLPAYQKNAWWNNGRFIHTKPGMCLNVAGLVPLFSQSMLCVPNFPRERARERERQKQGEQRRECEHRRRG